MRRLGDGDLFRLLAKHISDLGRKPTTIVKIESGVETFAASTHLIFPTNKIHKKEAIKYQS